MSNDNLGLDLQPGDEHYRAYVGPPQDYDLIAAMVFNLLTTLKLRQHHKVLDIGCGSLRIGRLLIPYLNAGNYYGVEPNAWLIEEGIKNELGHDQVELKKPNLFIGESVDVLRTKQTFDYAFAQSIFSHCGIDLIHQWLKGVSGHLNDSGVFLATFVRGNMDFDGSGWIYPGCVKYTLETMSKAGEAYGLSAKVLDWWHPRQTWCLYYKPGFDISWVPECSLSWNDAYASQK